MLLVARPKSEITTDLARGPIAIVPYMLWAAEMFFMARQRVGLLALARGQSWPDSEVGAQEGGAGREEQPAPNSKSPTQAKDKEAQD